MPRALLCYHDYMKWALAVLIVALAVTPALLLAQSGPLVPCDGPNCNFCSLVALSQNIINFLVYLAGAFATIMFAYAGIKYATAAANPSQIEEAHKIFWNVLIGIVFVLAAWLIVNTVMVSLYETRFSAGLPWHKILCSPQSAEDIGAIGPLPVPSAPSGIESVPESTSPAVPGDDAAARSTLGANNIPVESTGNCSDQNNPNCTSLSGIKPTTLTRVVNLKQECRCDVIVTGGTEAGHMAGDLSHGSGYKVDLSGTASLSNYIQTNFTRTGTRSGAQGGPIYTDALGNQYVLEGDHWDVTVKSI